MPVLVSEDINQGMAQAFRFAGSVFNLYYEYIKL